MVNTKTRSPLMTIKRGLLIPLVILLMSMTALVFVSRLHLKDHQLQQLFNGFSAVVPNAGSYQAIPLKKDDGLLPGGFDDERSSSCLSRHESVQYLKELKRQPSSTLISKLRSYEALHRRCGPYTKPYNKTVELIITSKQLPTEDYCKYVVWIPFSGLGNRILSLTSAFLYALLTNRILLVAPMPPMDHMSHLFCEPFPGTSWILPEDFPVPYDYLYSVDQNKSSYCYGYMVKHNLIIHNSNNPPLVYLNLVHDMDRYDELFFKDEDQMFLRNIPWLSVMSDEYWIPSLFLMESFKKDLENMFPDKDSVFHILGRYLFHPTNPVWGLITRYHQSYLAGADEKIGIQVRVFDDDEPPGHFQHVLHQIINCTMENNILPPLIDNNLEDSSRTNKKNKTTKAVVVLMTSLSSWYADMIRDMYLQHPTFTGDVIIRVHQPSHEEHQKMGDGAHEAKALAEMYLLGMSDRLVISGWSTFGYVGQGLGGLLSWVLYKPENRTAPDAPCQRFISMEPCYHFPPPLHNSTAARLPYVRPCEDKISGLKLYQDI